VSSSCIMNYAPVEQDRTEEHDGSSGASTGAAIVCPVSGPFVRVTRSPTLTLRVG